MPTLSGSIGSDDTDSLTHRGTGRNITDHRNERLTDAETGSSSRRDAPTTWAGWKILLKAQWPWVASAPESGGKECLVYRVEALILSPSS